MQDDVPAPRARSKAWAASLAVLAIVGVAQADVVHLSRGRKVEGDVVEERAKSVVVRVGGAEITIDRSEVVSIERSPTPAQAFRERRGKLTEGDAGGALALADAAAAAGLVEEEGEALKLAAHWEKTGDVAASRLRAWTRAYARLPSDPDEETRLVDDMGVPAQSYRSMHWVIAYDGTLADVRRTSHALEAVWRTLHRLSDDLGVEAKPVGRALSAQLFTDYDAWTAAVGRSSSELSGVVGVYVARNGRLALQDAATRPQSLDLGARLRLLSDQLAAAEAARRGLESGLRRFQQDVAYARMAVLNIRSELLLGLAAALDRLREDESRRAASLKASVAAASEDLQATRIVLLGDEGRRLQARARQAVLDLDAEPPAREALLAAAIELQSGLRSRCEDGRNVLALDAWHGLEEIVDPLAEIAREHSSATRKRRDVFEAILKDLDDAFAASNLAAASHAACIQLAVATGLLVVDDPMWLLEGLASTFDAADGRSLVWEKPQLDRLRATRDQWKATDPGWLARIVGGTAFAEDSAAASSGAYVVVWYLCRERPRELARFLTRDRAAAGAGEDRDVREFERHFGPTDEFESAVLKYLEHR